MAANTESDLGQMDGCSLRARCGTGHRAAGGCSRILDRRHHMDHPHGSSTWHIIAQRGPSANIVHTWHKTA